MFVTPLVDSITATLQTRAPAPPLCPLPRRGLRGPSSTGGQHVLLAWMIAGVLVLLCIPAARGGRHLGATLPFWLVIAPALDLIWLSRRRVARMVRASAGTARRETARQARRTRRAA